MDMVAMAMIIMVMVTKAMPMEDITKLTTENITNQRRIVNSHGINVLHLIFFQD